MSKVQITEYLDIELEKRIWCCRKCTGELISADESYKKGCLVYSRDPRTIYNTMIEGELNFAPDPEWQLIVEFYCPHCGIMVENEFLPPGHPITHDIDLDVDALIHTEISKRERV
ncbi:acetophenone carboxylase [Bacillus sp. M6-12]|uniref:acetone carboxylase subunit gamma n=1 Tax=Bacillus sp. M6-12 TaxID=2054166 RepID=UPI000C756B08|nr:acetone carboxylase subunit gamma [Bacillus sp. M6-12]PLS15278.1 acetophenone carboxylase [Bacillus sp. M6-12]